MMDQKAEVVMLQKGLDLDRPILDLDGKPIPLVSGQSEIVDVLTRFGCPLENINKVLSLIEQFSDPTKRAVEDVLTLRRVLRNGLVATDSSASISQITDRLALSIELAKCKEYTFSEQQKAELKEGVKRAYNGSVLVVGAVAMMLDGKM